MPLKPFEQLSRSQKYRRRRLGIVEDGRGKHTNGPSGSAHHRWNDGRMVTSHGYVKVRVGTSHPLADPNGYAYEHHLVVCSALGRLLSAGEVVHHRNGNKRDNRLDNLEVTTRAEHARRHSSGRFPETGKELDGQLYHELPTTAHELVTA